MTHRLSALAHIRPRAGAFLFVVASSIVAAAVGCSVDTDADRGGALPTPEKDGGGAALKDSGVTPDPEEDADVPVADAGADACDDGGCVMVLKGCAARPTASFCDDFDSPEALVAGKTKWDFVETAAQPVVTRVTDRSVSAPAAILTQIIDAASPGAKFAKTITKKNFTEATWEYDVYLESIGTTDGFFLDDFQFTDAVGPDTFGFRLVMFANAGAIDFIRVEHNGNAANDPYALEPALEAGKVKLGQWHHFKQTVKLAFGAGDAGADAGDANTAEYSLWVDGGASPTFKKQYKGITRAQAAFARIAGMPLVFNKANSAGLKIYFDNQILDLK